MGKEADGVRFCRSPAADFFVHASETESNENCTFEALILCLAYAMRFIRQRLAYVPAVPAESPAV